MASGHLPINPAAGRRTFRRALGLRLPWMGGLLLLVVVGAFADPGLAQPPQAADPQCTFAQGAQPSGAPDEAMLLVEIPAGSFTKYEIDDDGLVQVDRFLSMPVSYPANYGALPGTLAGDGDRLDALVLTRAPLYPGVRIRFRPIGVLRMLDAGERDDKIIGVPADDVDPHYAHVRDMGDLPPAQRSRLEAFFRVYKDLPDGPADNPVRLQGFGDAAEARTLIGESLRRKAESARAASGCVGMAPVAG